MIQKHLNQKALCFKIETVRGTGLGASMGFLEIDPSLQQLSRKLVRPSERAASAGGLALIWCVVRGVKSLSSPDKGLDFLRCRPASRVNLLFTLYSLVKLSLKA